MIFFYERLCTLENEHDTSQRRNCQNTVNEYILLWVPTRITHLEAQENCFYLTGTKASPNRGCRHLFRLSKTLLVRVAITFLTQIICSGAQKNHLIIRNHGSQFVMRGCPYLFTLSILFFTSIMSKKVKKIGTRM